MKPGSALSRAIPGSGHPTWTFLGYVQLVVFFMIPLLLPDEAARFRSLLIGLLFAMAAYHGIAIFRLARRALQQEAMIKALESQHGGTQNQVPAV